MRIVIDALCAEFGGIRTYVEHLLGGWHSEFPDDEVHVALRQGSTLATPGLQRHELAIARPDTVGRPLAQATTLHRLTRAVAPDVILATAPTTDVRKPVAPLAVTILDLRAEILPDQFSRGRRLLRTVSYGRSYRLASGFIAISQRSLDDLHRLHPSTRRAHGRVAYLGSDHVSQWPSPSRTGPAVAFAHHTNKNPGLVIEAWARLCARGVEVPPLTFLGVARGLRSELQESIDRLNLDSLVQLSPFLDDDEFQQVFTAANIVVFPSDFEGFGLPIVESMALGKPVVIAPDAGCLEVAGRHASVAKAWTADDVADAVERALVAPPSSLETAAAWAGRFQWATTIHDTRDALLELTRGGRA
ncbi:MAG: glycosyltransferase family 1 protein [Marmoricola sp.]